MSPPSTLDTGHCRRKARRARVGQIVRHTLYAKVGLVFVVLVLAGAFYLRLVAGPISLEDYGDRVEEALASRLGPGWTVDIAATALELQGGLPAIRTSGLEIRNPAGLAVIRAPYAVVSLDPLSLLVGTFLPREIELRDIQLKAVIGRDGSLSFEPPATDVKAPGEVAANGVASGRAGPPGVAAAPVVDGPPPSVVSTAIASLLDPIVNGTSIIGSLDRATIAGARLTLVDADGLERAAFRRVSAAFERLDGGGRSIDIELDGTDGPWRVRGRVSGTTGPTAELEFDGISLSEVLALGGAPRLRGGSDVKLAGRLSAAMASGRLTRLDGGFESNAASFVRRGLQPIVIDHASGRGSWNEAAEALQLGPIEVRSGGTSVRLGGELHKVPDGWGLTLRGGDAVVAGVSAGDGSFTISKMELDATLAGSGASLQRASLVGPGLSMEASGSFALTPTGPSARARLEILDTDVRRLVRIWPDTMNLELRAFLASRLEAGTVNRLRLTSVLDGPDFPAAFSDDPLSDGALALEFSASRADLSVIDGLPALRGLTIEGRASGTKASVQAKSGHIDMPDGRSLSFEHASFVQANLDKPDSVAQVSFRIVGGVDALASFLRSPLIRDAGGVDVDPAILHGRADVRATVAFAPKNIPPLAEMPFSASAALTDVQVDKLPGREKLEGGSFTLNYDAGALSLRGDGRLSGTPATFDLQTQRSGIGEVAVSLTLDEAARTRRSLPSGSQLSGAVPVRIVAGLGSRSQAGTKIEVDLTRAGVDGLIPGWTKPPNKPGRVAFFLVDGETTELRDLVVEAGSVQIKGKVTLNASGGFERADFPTFRLSPGDDLKAQVDRGAGGDYKIVLRGNNADLRPVLKWLNAPSSKAGGRDPFDVDLDTNFNILTGHNDEAMTGVSARVSAHGGELRSLQMTGRFRSAIVEAQLAKRDGGTPVLTIRSGDAGSTLRFVDLYRRLVGGKLLLEARYGGSAQEGRVTIDDFGLRGEPALRRIASQASQQQQGGGDERGIAPIARPDLDQVLFNKLSADFRRSASRVDFSDAVIYGAQIGFNLSGFVDFGRDRLDILGTFVPAYMLNNALTQLPVVGLLMGGRNEGLFAVEFRVTGQASGPTLTVNPLTAVAPGILRKLFGWMLPEGERETPPATGTTQRRN